MIVKFFSEIWSVLLQLSGPLLLGALIAGIIHVVLPARLVQANLGRKGLGSAVKAAAVGVPLPLCSCSVIPAAIGLRQNGASNGASVSFMISTPQTGADSILVSAAFLGWPFAIFKMLAAFVTGIIGGTLTDLLVPGVTTAQQKGIQVDRRHNNPVLEVLRYGVFDLLGMIYKWIVLGIVIAAIINLVVKPGALSRYEFTQGISGMILMLLVALPLYVCATGSVPIATSLVAAGVPTGAALVFLMAGPATNIATVGAVYRVFGGRVLAVYLGVVAVFSMIFAALFGFVISSAPATQFHHHHDQVLWPSVISAVIVTALFGFLGINEFRRRIRGDQRLSYIKRQPRSVELDIKGMTCQHCAAAVTNALRGVPGVTSAEVYVERGLAVVAGDVDVRKLVASVEKAGYQATARQR